jgi:hypothetical protein
LSNAETYIDVPPIEETPDYAGMLHSFAEVEEQEADFYWYPYIRRGGINTITAIQSTGKSLINCKLAAMASLGRRGELPLFDRWDRHGEKHGPFDKPETTIYLNVEDDPATDTKSGYGYVAPT